ncbi:MAG TPA: xanthine dehydrogenase family protein subunit M [Bacillota bacterium]
MIPAAFDYHRAATLDEAVRLLQELGADARLLAGGHSLLPAMKLRLARPTALIDIGRIESLRGVRQQADHVEVGALARHADLAAAQLPAGLEGVRECAGVIGDPQVRRRGTIGGSLCHADPSADWPAVALALEARLVVAGPGGQREVAAVDWFTGPFMTALGPGEILAAIRFPRPPARTGSAYVKLARKASDFAIAGAAARVTVDDGGRCTAAGVAVTGVADVPYRATAVEDLLVGRTLDDDIINEAAGRAADAVDPVADVHAPAEYRAQAAQVYVRRALKAALQRAVGRPAA